MNTSILILVLFLFAAVLAYAFIYQEKRINDRVRIKIGGLRRRHTQEMREVKVRLEAVEARAFKIETGIDPALKSANPQERSEARHASQLAERVVVNGVAQAKG